MLGRQQTAVRVLSGLGWLLKLPDLSYIFCSLKLQAGGWGAAARTWGAGR